MGKVLNVARTEIEAALESKLALAEEREKQARLSAEAVDVTLPGKRPARGTLHPITQVREDIVRALPRHGVRGGGRSRDRERPLQLPAPQRPQGSSRTRHAGHLLRQRFIRAAHAHFSHAGAHDDHEKAPHPRRHPGQGLSLGRRRLAQPHLPSDRGACGGQVHHHGRPRRLPHGVCAADVLQGHGDPSAPLLLPLHGAFRRSGRHLRDMRRQGLQSVQRPRAGWRSSARAS